MEKRVLLAVFLSFLVLYAFQSLVVKPKAPDAKGPAASRAAQQPATPVAEPGPSPGGVTVAEPPQQAAPAAEALVAAEAEREIVVENQVVRAVFSTRGGHVKSWQLKKYFDLQTRRPQELVPTDFPGDPANPFDLQVDDAAITSSLRNALFKPAGETSEGRVDATGASQTLTFEYKDAAGLSARKVFVFEPSSYVVRFDADVSVGGREMNPTVQWGPGLGDVTAGGGSSYEQKPQGMVFREGEVDRLDAGEVAEQPIQEGPFSVAGVDDHYFIAVALPVRNVRVEYQPVVLPDPAQDAKKARNYMTWGLRQAQSPEGLRYYFGPKDFSTLKSVDPRLVKAINFGILDWLAVPLLGGLNWIYGFVGNYGWSILILTFLINVVMFPLRHKSMVSMRKMQAIQPEVKAIQERYKKFKATDPERQKMNTEMMNLYRERGVNPASGCVPMLLTLPVLFAFYSLLSQAIEMRGAPFIGWIQDLSRHDPYYVTPILMGASQVWQQKMTPAGGDPMQQKMMMAMPVVFTFMFLWAPSGLVIYWFASNILAIGQQYLTNHLAGPPRAAAKAPAAARAPVPSPNPAPPVTRRKGKKG